MVPTVVAVAGVLVLASCGRSDDASTAAASPEPAPKPTPTATPSPEPARTPTPPLGVVVEMPPAEATATPAPLPEQAEGMAIPSPEGGPSPEWQRAVDLFYRANALQFRGRLEEAVDAYQGSIVSYPTAEAYTFLGWTYSWMGRYDLAIAEAQKAIEIDPDFGNPYNDIGAYLTEMGQLDEAIPWLEKAMTAKRYENPHFPHMNLGKIWVRKGMWDEAMASFEAALRLAPEISLPPLPTLVPRLPAPPRQTGEPSTEALEAVTDAMVRYIRAWNAYDYVALLEMSAPPSPESLADTLFHLADARMERSKIQVMDMQVIYLSDRIGIMKALVEIRLNTLPVSYLLTQDEGTWRVVGRTVVGLVDPEGDVPLN